MSFDPDAYLAKRAASSGGGFNPDAYLASKAKRAQPASDAVGAAVEGFGQGASMGYLPQLQAMVGQFIPDPSADVDAKLSAEGFTIEQPKSDYLSLRDENIRRNEALAKSNPYVYGGAQLAGLVATAPVAEATALKALPTAATASRLGRAVSTGAFIGGVQNPGDVEGEISPFQAGMRASNAAIGGAIGLGGDLLARGAEKGAAAIKGLGAELKQQAQANAVRGAGGQKSQFNKLAKGGKLDDVSEFIIDNGLADASKSGKEIQDAVNTLKGEAANEIKQVGQEFGKAGDKGLFDRKDLADKMRTSLLDETMNSIDDATILPKFEKYIDDFEKKAGPATMEDVQNLRRQFDDRINFAKRHGELSENEAIFKNWRRIFSSEVDQKATSIGGKVGERLRAANKKYSMASEVGKLADNKVAQEGNNYFGLTDRIAGASFGAAGAFNGEDIGDRLQNAALGAAAGAVGSKALRTYGPGVATKGMLRAAALAERLAPAAAAVEEYSAPVLNRLRLKALENEPTARKKLPTGSRKRLQGNGRVMEFIGLAFFVCFILALLEWREHRHRSEFSMLKSQMKIQHDEALISIKGLMGAFKLETARFEDQSQAVRDTLYRIERHAEFIVKAHEQRLSGSEGPPKDKDYFEELA